MTDLKKRYVYLTGGWNNPQTGQALQQGAGMLGSYMSQLDQGGKGPSNASGAASGALTGASMGAAAGPIGMAAGAIIGGVVGTVSAEKKRKQIEEQQNKLNKQIESQYKLNSQVVLQNYPSQGVEVSGYYAKYGGQVPTFLTKALAEGGEVAVSESLPLTDQYGDMNPLASNVSKFEGVSHDSPSGGIGFNSTSDTFIFSDALRTQEGITFAKAAELLGKKKGKFEQKLQNSTDQAAYNTAERMIKRFDNQLADLYNQQEMMKYENEKI